MPSHQQYTRFCRWWYLTGSSPVLQSLGPARLSPKISTQGSFALSHSATTTIEYRELFSFLRPHHDVCLSNIISKLPVTFISSPLYAFTIVSPCLFRSTSYLPLPGLPHFPFVNIHPLIIDATFSHATSLLRISTTLAPFPFIRMARVSRTFRIPRIPQRAYVHPASFPETSF